MAKLHVFTWSVFRRGARREGTDTEAKEEGKRQLLRTDTDWEGAENCVKEIEERSMAMFALGRAS